ncbi:MAG: FkbM family methyltransferase [Beijerinckiaceae bacterium]|nr:FkbM family methyltransferase [Beijerinckiaceae bacterium]
MPAESRDQQVTTLVDLDFLNPLVAADLRRFGDKGDGGYLAPETPIKISDALLSFGLGNNWSFEKALADFNPDLSVHAYDHSVSGDQFRWKYWKSLVKFFLRIETLAGVRKSLKLHQSYTSFFQGRVQHFIGLISDQQDQPFFVTPEQAFSRLKDASNIVLKIDIEGSEYRIIEQVLDYKDKLTVVIVEFHNTDVFRPVFVKLIMMMAESFDIVHLHGNNFRSAAADGLPIVLEITFQHKRFTRSPLRRCTLPIEGMDYSNCPSRPDFSLRFKD